MAKSEEGFQGSKLRPAIYSGKEKKIYQVQTGSSKLDTAQQSDHQGA